MEKLKEKITRLLAYNNSPQEIARGVACGVFIGITPFYGFHTLLVIAAAFIIPQTNKIAILLGTNISLPMTVPFITWLGYTIGIFVLGGNYPTLTLTSLQKFSPQTIFNLFYPLVVGSLILGLVAAFIFYHFILRFLLHRRAQRKKGAVR